MQSAVTLGSCRRDSSSSETKDEGALSRGSGGQMPHFLSDLAPLARSQPVVKCSGKLVHGKKGGGRARMTFCGAWAAFPQPALSPHPSPRSPNLPAQSEGCGVAVAPAAVRLGSRAFRFCSPAS